MKILISRSNNLRYPKFRIQTLIYKKNSQILVRKIISDKKSINHLNNIYKSYNYLKKNFSDIKFPQITNKNKFYIEFKYLPYPSLEKIIENSIINQNYFELEKYFKIYLNFLNKLKIEKQNPYLDMSFVNFFDKEKKYYSKNKEEIINPGILDLNLDNILFEKNNFYFIDFEWIFNFPIPKNYVIFRAIFYLCNKLQSIIKTSCSDKFPCVEILENLLIPKLIWDNLNLSYQDIERFLFYEINFQNNVNIIKINFNKEIIKQKLIIHDKSYPNPYNLQNLINQLNLANQQNLNLQYNKNEFNYNELKAHIQNLEDQLNTIKSAKFFKFWQSYNKILKFFKIKK